MNKRIWLSLMGSVLVITSASATLIQGRHPEQTQCPMSQKQMEELNKRGDKEMGFSHMKTTHHFLLAADGGAIQVEANNENDTESRDQIRSHLKHIAMMFGSGNFDTPLIIHAKTPPGTDVMQRLKEEIHYKFKETPRGGVIHITTTNTQALQAIQEFLRFQIKEHNTGDSLEVAQGPTN